MKNNKGLICIIIVLFLIIIGLVSYIFLEKSDDSKLENNKTTTKEKITPMYFDETDDVYKLKLEDNKTYKINEDYNLDIEKIENLEKVTYEFYVGEDNAKIVLGNDFNDIYINNKIVVEANFIQARILNKIKSYNNTLIIMFSYGYDEHPQTLAIDIKNQKVVSDVCFPEANGKCTGFEYEYVESDIYETEYGVDYNNELTKVIINNEKFNCDFISSFFDDDEVSQEECLGDEKCERRFPICIGP